MRPMFAAMALVVLLAAPAGAQDLTTIKSKYSVKETLNRLSAALTEKGIRVVARVNHAAGAKAAGLALKPSELLIFGNPKLGTPLMQSNLLIGLDLPMKVLAYEDDAGQVHVAFTPPEVLAKRYAVADRSEIVAKMTKALGALTAAAAGAK